LASFLWLLGSRTGGQTGDKSLVTTGPSQSPVVMDGDSGTIHGGIVTAWTDHAPFEHMTQSSTCRAGSEVGTAAAASTCARARRWHQPFRTGFCWSLSL